MTFMQSPVIEIDLRRLVILNADESLTEYSGSITFVWSVAQALS
jgi:hypothetical protein